MILLTSLVFVYGFELIFFVTACFLMAILFCNENFITYLLYDLFYVKRHSGACSVEDGSRNRCYARRTLIDQLLFTASVARRGEVV